MYGGSLSSQRSRSRDDLSLEFHEMDLDQRLPAPTRGCADAAAQLARLGVAPGRYSGAEQVFAPGSSCLGPAIELATCTIGASGTLAMTSQATGETTTFAWTGDRWCWSPYAGLTIEATPRRLGAVLIIDFVAWKGSSQAPAARVCLAADSTA